MGWIVEWTADALGRQPRWSVAVVVLLLVVVIGALDRATGTELAFSAFYLLPIGLGAWYVGAGFGLSTALACALTWLWADLDPGSRYSHWVMPYASAVVRLTSFATAAWTFAALHRALIYARTDSLTGLLNSRALHEAIEAEARRARRYARPFTIAYADVDRFKSINDRYGHTMGDAVLKRIAAVLTTSLRASDVVARVGGDEFVLLLPETNKEAASLALSKVRQRLRANDIPSAITISVGAVTVESGGDNTASLLQRADMLMYAAKRLRDDIRHEVLRTQPPATGGAGREAPRHGSAADGPA
jgi:diguanylate cyclase (GGDEF)-like protein